MQLASRILFSKSKEGDEKRIFLRNPIRQLSGLTEMIRWNFSSRAPSLSGCDAIVISIPKSGRTWVRAFLCAYFCERFKCEMTLEPERYGREGIPRIVYSHDLFEHRTKADLWDRLRGKYLIPARELRKAKIILLARDPRDAFISLYLQLTRRTKETPDTLKQKTVGALLRDDGFGIRSMVEVMNTWLEEFIILKNFTLLRYEILRQDPVTHFRDVLAAIGDKTVQLAAYKHALAFSDFDHMKKLEATGAFESKILRAGDVADPESFKVRRGKIGGYRDYLSVEDQAYAAAAVRSLDGRFGYSA